MQSSVRAPPHLAVVRHVSRRNDVVRCIGAKTGTGEGLDLATVPPRANDLPEAGYHTALGGPITTETYVLNLTGDVSSDSLDDAPSSIAGYQSSLQHSVDRADFSSDALAYAATHLLEMPSEGSLIMG